MTYDVHYFITKFESTTEQQWMIEDYTDGQGHFCALGFCGETLLHNSPEAQELKCLFQDKCWPIGCINDGDEAYRHWGDTPRERILNALYEIRRREREAQKAKSI